MLNRTIALLTLVLVLALPAHAQKRSGQPNPAKPNPATCEQARTNAQQAAFGESNSAATVIGVAGGLIGGLIAVGIRQSAADAAGTKAYDDCMAGTRPTAKTGAGKTPETRQASRGNPSAGQKAVPPPPALGERKECPASFATCSGANEQCTNWCVRNNRPQNCSRFCATRALECLDSGVWEGTYCRRDHVARR